MTKTNKLKWFVGHDGRSEHGKTADEQWQALVSPMGVDFYEVRVWRNGVGVYTDSVFGIGAAKNSAQSAVFLAAVRGLQAEAGDVVEVVAPAAPEPQVTVSIAPETPEPAPLFDCIRLDLDAREAGRKTEGVTSSGDALSDAYAAALDVVITLRQAIREREGR